MPYHDHQTAAKRLKKRNRSQTTQGLIALLVIAVSFYLIV